MSDARRRTGLRLLLAVIAAAPVLVILLGLGTWQVQRLAWKTEMLERMAAAESGPAEPLFETAEPFARVTVTGRFDHLREVMLGVEPRNGVLGGHLVTPLLRAADPTVLVDRGWAPFERGGTTIQRPAGEVTIEGWIRPGEKPNRFSAVDDVANRRFYTFDPEAIAAAIGLRRLEPFGVVALAPAASPGAPRAAVLPEPASTLPKPPNNHLGYAITWYGLAASLVYVLIAYARRLRSQAAGTGRRSRSSLLRQPEEDAR